jgi:hypothetical protein
MLWKIKNVSNHQPAIFGWLFKPTNRENHPVNVLDLGQMWAIHAGKACQTNTNALETSAM